MSHLSGDVFSRGIALGEGRGGAFVGAALGCPYFTPVPDFSLGIAAAVAAHPYAAEIMGKADAPEGQRRNVVRTVMLLAAVGEAK